MLEKGDFDLVITDHQLRWTDGLTVLRAVKARYPDCPAIMFTATGSEEVAVEAMKAGLDDYVLKSPQHRVRLPGTVRSALARARHRQAVREAESRYRNLFESMPLGLCRITPEGQFLDVNPALVEIFGYPDRESLLAVNAAVLYANDEDYRQWQVLVDREAVVRDFEAQMRRRDGTIIWVRHHGRAAHDARGRILHCEGSREDITERKLAEAQYRTMLRRAMDGFWLLDMQGRIVDGNDAYCRMTGYSRDELLKMGIQDVEVAEEPEETVRHIQHVIETGWDRFETRHRCKDGRVADIEVSVQYTGLGGGRLFAFLRDITERKRAEEELIRLRKAVDASGEVVFLTDRNGIIIFVNPEFTRLYGYTAAEVVGKTTPRILKSGIVEARDYEQFWQMLLGLQVVKGELINKTRDGRLIPIESSANSVLDESGNVVGFLAIQRDITERKRTEEALRESEQRYRVLFESVPVGIGMADLAGNVLAVNRSLEEMTGYGLEEFKTTRLQIS